MTALQNRYLLSISFATAMMAALFGATTSVVALTNSECSELLDRPTVYISGTLLEPYRKALVDSGRAVFQSGEVGRMTVITGCNSGAFDDIEVQATVGLPASKKKN